MSWLDELPEQLRDAPFIGKAESAEDALGKLAHAAKLVGTSIRIPDEGAAEDDRKAFYDKLAEVPGVTVLPDTEDMDGMSALMGKLGKPAEAKDYALPEIENFEWDTDIANNLREYALEAGMTKAQFKQFAQKIGEQELAADAEANAAKTQYQKEIREEWGVDYDNREALIRGWMDKSEAPETMRELLENGTLPPDAMKWLHDVAKNFEGDVSPMTRDQKDAGSPGVTPAEAREKIADILSSEPYWNKEHPLHRDFVQRMVHMQKLANPEKAA